MSAKGRNVAGYEPESSDFYATPYWCTRAILRLVTPSTQGRPPIILDPFAGEGAILDVCKAAGYQTAGIELHAGRAERAASSGHAVQQGNSFVDEWPKADAVITNPPYSMTIDSVKAALKFVATHGVDAAFLLRLGFLGSQDRADFHKNNLSDFYVLPRRPQYAMSVSCSKKKTGCEWGVRIPYLPTGELSEPAPARCPKCSAETTSSSSDASEYAWFVYGPNRGGRWSVLDVEPARAVAETKQIGLFT